MELTFVEASMEDAQALRELFVAYSRELEQYEMAYTLVEDTLLTTIQSRIRSRMTLAAVAKDGQTVVGFLFCNISRLSGYTYGESPLFGYISDTFVTPAYRGRGIAAGLTRMAVDWLTGNDVAYVELKVLHSNRDAHRFWQSRGFAPTTMTYGMKLKGNEGIDHDT